MDDSVACSSFTCGEGPDLWLSFEVMPSFDGELGLLIVNRPRNRAVVPISGIPLPGEIRMRMTEVRSISPSVLYGLNRP